MEIFQIRPTLTVANCDCYRSDPGCRHGVWYTECAFCGYDAARATNKHGPYFCPHCKKEFMGMVEYWVDGRGDKNGTQKT